MRLKQFKFFFFFFSTKKPDPKKNKVRMGVLLNNETVKEIANFGAGFNNINDTSSKKEATVFVVLDMHPGLMDPTETLGKSERSIAYMT